MLIQFSAWGRFRFALTHKQDVYYQMRCEKSSLFFFFFKKICMVQHWRPAHRGEEITADVFEEDAEEIVDEAENRLHAQKAVMYLLMGGED